jgi:Flp pilus assembly protein TadD
MLTDGLQENKSLVDTALGAAEVLRRAGRYEQGIDTLVDVLQEQPNEAAVYFRLGNLYIDQGDLERAKEAYCRAVELDPNHASALNNLAVVYKRQKRTRLFVQTYKQAQRATLRSSRGADRNSPGTVARRRRGLGLLLVLLIAGVIAFCIWVTLRG